MSNSNTGVTSPISPLLRIEQVAELLGCSERHVRNLHREGRMPPRIAISERLVGWRESDLEAWLQSNREERSDV
jgi:excisionase family DNA binding protein